MCGLCKKIYGKFAQTQLGKGQEGTELALIQQELKIPNRNFSGPQPVGNVKTVTSVK
jgi:hypothetical protein